MTTAQEYDMPHGSKQAKSTWSSLIPTGTDPKPETLQQIRILIPDLKP